MFEIEKDIKISMEDLKKIKQIQLDGMDLLHKFCKKNNLKYSLAYGSMLGAVRHKGYIPWDDDIDIVMPRKDYEYLINNFDTEDYGILKKGTPGYFLPYAKINHKKSRLIEEANYQDYNGGVFIDVFPLDAIDNNKVKYIINHTLIMAMKKIQLVKLMKFTNRGFLKNSILVLLKIFSKTFSMKFLQIQMDRLAQKFNKNEHDEYLSVQSASTAAIHNKYFDKVMEVPFEDRFYYILPNYHDILSRIYGEYLVIPPMESRISNHQFSISFSKI